MANGNSLENIQFDFSLLNDDPNKTEKIKLKKNKDAIEKEMRHFRMQIERISFEIDNKRAEYSKVVNKMNRRINEKKYELEKVEDKN